MGHSRHCSEEQCNLSISWFEKRKQTSAANYAHLKWSNALKWQQKPEIHRRKQAKNKRITMFRQIRDYLWPISTVTVRRNAYAKSVQICQWTKGLSQRQK